MSMGGRTGDLAMALVVRGIGQRIVSRGGAEERQGRGVGEIRGVAELSGARRPHRVSPFPGTPGREIAVAFGPGSLCIKASRRPPRVPPPVPGWYSADSDREG